MTTEAGRFVWRVRATDGAAHSSAFDALILPTDPAERARWPHPTRLLAVDVPHESEQTDTPLVLIVRARADAGPLVVECEAIGPDGVRHGWGRANDPLAVIVRSATGILVTGLSEPTVEPLPPAK